MATRKKARRSTGRLDLSETVRQIHEELSVKDVLASHLSHEQKVGLLVVRMLLKWVNAKHYFQRFRPFLDPGILEIAESAYDLVVNRFRRARSIKKVETLGTIKIALELLLENIELQRTTAKRIAEKRAPSADELCSACQLRIHSRSTSGSIRIVIPSQPRAAERMEYVEAAWLRAREAKIFETPWAFAKFASTETGLNPRTIYNYVRDI